MLGLTMNHVSPDHVGPLSALFCCCVKSLTCSSKSSVVPSDLLAIVLL